MIIATRPTFVNDLQTKMLHEPLPGMASHFKMAHAVRRVETTPDSVSKKDAAVLITLFEKTPGDWYLVFIRRATSHVQDKHAGQIAFPGGKHEDSDPDLMFTALREAHEETAIDLAGIDILGQLTPLYITVSKFMVHPFLAYSWKIPELTAQEGEIQEILELPLAHFLEPQARQDTRIHLTTGIVLNHVPSYRVNGHTIWGATAMIMSEFLDLLQR